MSGPEFDLEAALAADEASIRDNGFSARVAERAARSRRVRRFVIGGAGVAGLGFAAGGLFEMRRYLPDMSGWWAEAMTAFTRADQDAGRAIMNADFANGSLFAVAALAAGLLATVIAFSAAQSR
jgi:hypothetical protein